MRTPDFGGMRRPSYEKPGTGRQHPTVSITGRGRRAFARLRRARELLEAGLFPEAEGDQLHIILDSQALDPGDVLTAAVEKIAAAVAHLRISTLSLSSKRNLLQLVGMVDGGAVRKLSLLVSEFFREHSPDIWRRIADEFGPRGIHFAACRTHAKVFTLDVSDGRGYALYGSGNLRTAKSYEQLTLVRDRQVHDFYAAWIQEQIDQHARPDAQP